MLVYTNGGDSYVGHLEFGTLSTLKNYGKRHSQTWMYKGYRWYDGKRDIVVVFDTQKWNVGELARRKVNGFMGIRATRL